MRTIEFAGYEWNARAGYGNPGGNLWSPSRKDVWADQDGLHLTIHKGLGGWYCTDVAIREPLGYGTYEFTVQGSPQDLDKRVINGYFLYPEGGDPAAGNVGEIDIEIGEWGVEHAKNVQFVVQPHDLDGHTERLGCGHLFKSLVYRIKWAPEWVEFSVDIPGRGELWSWRYPHPVPDMNQHVHMDLWLLGGKASDGFKGQEVLVSDFQFTAWEE